MRQSVFKGLRLDKDPLECIIKYLQKVLAKINDISDEGCQAVAGEGISALKVLQALDNDGLPFYNKLVE